MTIKKKMKTKIDYQIRTFAICVSMLTIFTLIFVVPKTRETKLENLTLQQQIEDSNAEKIKLQEELEALTAQIMNEE